MNPTVSTDITIFICNVSSLTMTSNLTATAAPDQLQEPLDDEFISFLEDDEVISESILIKPWKVLVTDDDQTVHD